MVVNEIRGNVLMRMLSVTYNTHTSRIIYRLLLPYVTPPHSAHNGDELGIQCICIPLCVSCVYMCVHVWTLHVYTIIMCTCVDHVYYLDGKVKLVTTLSQACCKVVTRL